MKSVTPVDAPRSASTASLARVPNPKGLAPRPSDLGDIVPQNLEEMVKVFGPLVRRHITRVNQVPGNTEDITQHVFLKLVEVDVVSKYKQSHASLPPRLTGEVAAAYCGMTFDSFKQAVKSSLKGNLPKPFKGFTRDQRRLIFERDQGKCHRCDRDMGNFAERLKHLQKVDPARHAEVKGALLEKHGVEARVQIFWGIERLARRKPRSKDPLDGLATICLLCLYARHRQAHGDLRVKVGAAPLPVEGTYSFKTALYCREDVEAYREDRLARKVPPNPKANALALPKRSSFRTYLLRAAHNHYLNWCRTKRRKCQELFKGPTEDGQAWESFCADESTLSPEDFVAINDATNREIDAFLEQTRRRKGGPKVSEEKVLSLFAEGRSSAEVARELKVARVKVRAG